MAKNVDKLRIYIKPTCTTCKKAVKKLSEGDKNFESVNYYEQRFTKKKIREILDKIDVEPKDLLRKREKTYKKLDLGKKRPHQAAGGGPALRQSRSHSETDRGSR